MKGCASREAPLPNGLLSGSFLSGSFRHHTGCRSSSSMTMLIEWILVANISHKIKCASSKHIKHSVIKLHIPTYF